VSNQDAIALFAEELLRLRRNRAKDFPQVIFSEPAWDLLLELFVADAKGYQLTGRDVVSKCSIPAVVMSMWLRHLTKIGLLVGDGSGNLDDCLTLSARGLERMEQTLSRPVGMPGALTF
jgi:hypothetical protein